MVDDWVIKTMYATKRRRRTVKSVKAPSKDPPKSNPSKRHRERLNSELDHLASLLPFEQSVISKLDKLSILRLAVSFLRTKAYFQAVLPDRYNLESHHHIISRSHFFPHNGFSEGESILQALYGFLFVVTCDGEVFFAARTVEQYLGFHQSDIIHQSVMELIHSEDREEFKKQLTWNSTLPQEKSSMTLHEIMMPENYHYLHRSFTVRFRCLLDNTSGFITLEINGWIRLLHNNIAPRSTEEPQMGLFATCCPFGPLSLLDLPSRELTFKSKHKMDFSPMSMDNRGKMMFGFSDRELATKSGYDLVHPDDLNYFSAAHQELIKTGSSGLIAYRWLTKEFRWIWLQSSCKVIYKNSKPDFVICTHRQLTDDEGQDLFHKRGNEFKLPYPLLDLDICSGFDFPNDEMMSKMKNGKQKKQKNQGGREYLQSPGRKRKTGCRDIINGINGFSGNYPQYGNFEGSDFKPEILYPYPPNNFGIEPEVYRPHGYTGFPGTVYPSAADTYGFTEAEKHSYANGYYLDSHRRQYQHTLGYHGNGYPDLMTPASKYGYGFGCDSYGLELAKKVHYGEDLSRLDNDFRKYAYEYGSDRLQPRLNGSLEPVDLRSSSMYGSTGYVNGVDSMVSHGSGYSSSSLIKPEIIHGQSLTSKETKVICSTNDLGQNGQGLTIPLQHNSVIKNNTSPRSIQNSRNSDHVNGHLSNNYNNSGRGNVISSPGSSWNPCLKNSSPNSTPRSDHSCSPKQSHGKSDGGMLSTSSPVTGATQASVIHTPIHLMDRSPPNRSCEKQPLGGIPVPVVKTSPWVQYHTPHSSYGDPKDWSVHNDLYSCHQKSRGIIADTMAHISKVTIQ
ncbi:aryl hydrocarbon receptor protein 1-like isoform X1 [Mytilus trossulus]|uniref:aryl hydrocarbon receptor protein 1-like isoform X1 n=1 Tax=Mytilus trossulus TaxID=6551 RepID=UPI003006D41B